jgi:tRNA(Arg) A34 adenosine deaminase TadA
MAAKRPNPRHREGPISPRLRLLSAMETSTMPAQGPHSDAWAWSQETHEQNMRHAIEAARVAAASGGPAIGAAIVDLHCRVIARGYRLVEACCDPTAHAETTAIRSAAARMGRFHLPDLVLYCTLEPCSMCLGACAWACLGGVVFGTDGTLAPADCFDRVNYCALEQAEDARRDGDRARLFVRGHVLLEETAALLEGEPSRC